MSKTFFIEDIKPGATGIEEVFSVKEAQKHKARNGDPYLRLVLQDRTGTIGAKIWKDYFIATQAESIVAGDVLQVDFEASEFNGEMQMIIKRAAKTKDFDMNELMKTSTKNIEGMWAQFVGIMETIKDKDIRTVALKIVKDPEIESKLKYSVAGVKVHHDFVGGLLEHMLEIIAVAEATIKLYPRANRSIILAGILLHDIGKITEFGMVGSTFSLTKPGYLLGHITIGIKMFEAFLPEGFPEDKKLAIEHIILSHHREPEFGAVVRPATIEAMIVACADLMSSTVRQYQKDLDEAPEDEIGFGEFQKYMKVKIWHKDIPEEE